MEIWLCLILILTDTIFVFFLCKMPKKITISYNQNKNSQKTISIFIKMRKYRFQNKKSYINFILLWTRNFSIF